MDKKVFRNRIIGYEPEVDPNTLLANSLNFRKHPKQQQEVIEGILDDVGFVTGVIVNKRTLNSWSDGQRNVETVLDGHLRVELALLQNENVPVFYVDLSPQEEAEVLAIFDESTYLAYIEKENLVKVLNEFETGNAAIQELCSQMSEKYELFDVDDIISDEQVNDFNTDSKMHITYNLIFDDESQEQRWFEFLKLLKEKFPNEETTASRIDAFIKESMGD